MPSLLADCHVKRLAIRRSANSHPYSDNCSHQMHSEGFETHQNQLRPGFRLRIALGQVTTLPRPHIWWRNLPRISPIGLKLPSLAVLTPHPGYFLAKFCLCHRMSNVYLQRECIVTKQLQTGPRGFHCKADKAIRVSTVSVVSLKTKFEGGPVLTSCQQFEQCNLL